jgi:hypothetical protein
MKHIILGIFFLLATVLLFAQEKEWEVGVTRTVDGNEPWSNDSKMVLVYIFSIIIIIFVLRTFRNKADA